MPANAESFAVMEIDGHHHVWIYRRKYTQGIKRIVCNQASDPLHPIDLNDAATITQIMTDVEFQQINQMLNDEAEAIRFGNGIE